MTLLSLAKMRFQMVLSVSLHITRMSLLEE